MIDLEDPQLEQVRKENFKEMQDKVKSFINVLVDFQKDFVVDMIDFGNFSDDSYGLATSVIIKGLHNKNICEFIFEDNGYVKVDGEVKDE